MKYKSIIVGIITLILTGFLYIIGCTQKTDQSNQKPRIAYISKLKNESFHDSIANGVRKEMAKLHVHVDIFPAKNQQDVKSQMKRLSEIASAKNYRGVMLAPNDSKALVKYVKKIDEAGIPFILIDTPLAEVDETKKFRNDCGFVGTDNILAGKLAAQFILEKLSSGNIFMMRGNHKHRSSIDREKGFLKEMSKHSKFNLFGKIQGWWETEAAYKAFTQYVQQNTQIINAIFAYSDPMALGVSQYFSEHPEVKRPIIVGVDGTLVGQRGVLERKIDATIVQAAEVMGKFGLRNLMQCIDRKEPKRIVLTPVTLLKATMALEKVIQ